jgi:hypothetical protein
VKRGLRSLLQKAITKTNNFANILPAQQQHIIIAIIAKRMKSTAKIMAAIAPADNPLVSAVAAPVPGPIQQKETFMYKVFNFTTVYIIFRFV